MFSSLEKHTEFELNELLQALHAIQAQANADLEQQEQERMAQLRRKTGLRSSLSPTRNTAELADFYRPCGLTLTRLELTLYGYCGTAAPGGQPVFCLHRPGLWQRLWQPFPLLALHLIQDAEQSHAHFLPSVQAHTPANLNWIIHLDPAQQNALLACQFDALLKKSPK